VAKLTRIRSLLVAVLLSATSAFAQANYKVEIVNGLPSSDVPKMVQDVLQSQGARLVSDQGAAVCEMWLRKALPAQQSPNSSMDVLYGSLALGTMVGVLHFPSQGSDFRGQTLKPGYYTLRYEFVPQDGNHMGVSQYRDFLLLLPAAQDANPDAVLKFDEVVKLSRLATGSGHPGILSMDPTSPSASRLPAAFKDDLEHWALEVMTQLKDTAGGEKDFPLAIVLVGKYVG